MQEELQSSVKHSNVQGNQYNFYDQRTADIQALLSYPGDQMSMGQMDDLDVSDYRIFKYGDLQAITVPQRRFKRIWMQNDETDVQEFAVCVDNVANMKTARTYTGKNGLQSFKDHIRIIQDYR
ncbi:hypothetical protein AX14_009013 [Amanita brunnescens Koide BX004]|nr:hypothetical protein AX14_009013 [Amanita brunnescens Koide BX004]